MHRTEKECSQGQPAKGRKRRNTVSCHVHARKRISRWSLSVAILPSVKHRCNGFCNIVVFSLPEFCLETRAAKPEFALHAADDASVYRQRRNRKRGFAARFPAQILG